MGQTKDSKDSKAALAEAERARSSVAPVDQAAPPAYTLEGDPGSVPVEELTPALGGLSLEETSLGTPSPDACLAHLRLLYAFQVLKNEIGYKDGIFDIWDERAVGGNPQVLAALREKRWALYVARAVDRYASWWQSFVPDMLLESDMIEPGVEGRDGRYTKFTSEAKPVRWTDEMLPPLDVILVWHAHMLNPRLYLEDCLRYGHGSIWAGGMPWDLINRSIGNAFRLTTPASRLANWAERTSRDWTNENDPDTKSLRCPSCPTILAIPWTTCGLPNGYKGSERPGLIGEGYGDGNLNLTCKCGLVINHNTLRVAKLRDDINKNVTYDLAMPGTILELRNGLPEFLPEKDKGSHARLFPTRMARRGLLTPVNEMLKPGSKVEPTMLSVREIFEDYTGGRSGQSENVDKLRRVEGVKRGADVRVNMAARAQVRKMMSRYWQNASPFAIDLVGCVIRQGQFTEKMVACNWLHLPKPHVLMKDIVTKYERFIEILANYPGEVAVPTLDLDLGWHTHQLSPRSYFDFTVLQTTTFVDHNDKIDEDKLGVLFEWTTKIYQERYGEVYSQCRCWYCEATRTMTVSSFAKLFGKPSKEEKLLEQYHASGQSAKHPEGSSEPSAHLSAHPSVRTIETKARATVARKKRIPAQNRVEEFNEKARKRSEKIPLKGPGTKGKERMGPRDKDATPFWGVRVPIKGPWASATAAATSAPIYAVAPGVVTLGPGSVGSCASGTCGGAGGCGSEMLAMCYSAGKGNAPGGCTGWAGTGLGGGGGGGCGGGGGGGGCGGGG